MNGQNVLAQVNNSKVPASINKYHEADFQPYIKDLFRKIRLNRRNLYNRIEGTGKLKATVLVKLSRDGRLLSIHLIKSSGNTEFDQSFLNAIKISAPFSPLPSGYKNNDIDIKFTIEE